MFKKTIFLQCIVQLLLISSCGSDVNPNKLLFVRDADQKRVDVLISEAKILHDRGDYSGSLLATEEAGDLVSFSEELTQLKAFNELALAGFSIFDVIGKIIEQSGLQEGTDNSATDLLGGLSDILEISNEDLEALGTKSELPENDIIKGLSVFLPNYPGDLSDTESPRSQVKTLKYLNRAISTICPLISPELRSADPAIIDRYSCEQFSGKQTQSAQSYFVFFVAHLAETLVFNLVLLYSPENADGATSLHKNRQFLTAEKEIQDTSNIFKRINAVQTASKKEFSLSNIASISEATSEVVNNVKVIFDTEKGSMLYELMNNFRKAVGSFSYIEGMPESVTKQLTNSLTTIEKAADQAKSVSGNISGQTSALKEKMSNKIIAKLNSQVDAVLKKVEEYEAKADSLSAEDKAKVQEAKEKAKVMCDSMGTILADLPDITKPTGCDAL